jgi:hypothetical protein
MRRRKKDVECVLMFGPRVQEIARTKSREHLASEPIKQWGSWKWNNAAMKSVLG